MTRLASILVLLLAVPAVAQDRASDLRLGADMFRAGASVEITGDGIDDAFAAGERVGLAAPIGGNAHLAGRRVDINAEIGGDLYAAGADVTVSAPVAGDATLAGYDVNVNAPVGEDLRAGGANIRLDADVTGTALLAGESVEIDGVIGGDTVIAAKRIDFGPGARIDGRLVLYGEDADEMNVPESVVSADRIERRDIEERLEAGFEERRPGPVAMIGGFVIGVLVLAALATLAATIFPRGMERLRDIVGERPLRTFWIGFLTLSALIGATVLLILTLVGVFVAPAVLVLAVLLGFIGFLVAVYLVGRAIWGRFGGLPPDTFPEHAIGATIGAVAVSLLALVPFLGWLAILVLALTGLGGLTVAAFRPELRTNH